MREFSHSQPTVQMQSTSSCPRRLPPLLMPKGLDAKRKAHLFKEIREFCKEEFKDTVCPEPEVAEEMDTSSAAASDSDDDTPRAGGVSAQPMTSKSDRPATASKSTAGRRGHAGRASRGHGQQKPQQQQSDSDDDNVVPSDRQSKPDDSSEMWHGVKCVAACKSCHGLDCSNTDAVTESLSDTDYNIENDLDGGLYWDADHGIFTGVLMDDDVDCEIEETVIS